MKNMKNKIIFIVILRIRIIRRRIGIGAIGRLFGRWSVKIMKA